jgi:DNA-binding transcriptional LysR family regulator
MAEDARHALDTCVERHVSRGYARGVSRPDLNLLVALSVLLAEGSVAKAARRLQLSPSAMSRTLARLRASTGDPLLVRAGRALVATPRADELRERVGQLVDEGESLLRPATAPRPADIVRVFTLRTAEGFVESFGPALLRRVSKEAPRVRLRFLPRLDRDSGPLRDGAVDLETGVVGASTGPEMRAQRLFRDRFVGVVRARAAPAREGEGHALALRGGGARGGVAARARRAGGHGPAIARGLARDRPRRGRLRVGAGDGALDGLRRQRARATHGQPASGDAHVRAALRGAGDHRLDAVAPAARRRSRAPLAASLRARGLRLSHAGSPIATLLSLAKDA